MITVDEKFMSIVWLKYNQMRLNVTYKRYLSPSRLVANKVNEAIREIRTERVFTASQTQ